MSTILIHPAFVEGPGLAACIARAADIGCLVVTGRGNYLKMKPIGGSHVATRTQTADGKAAQAAYEWADQAGKESA